MKPRLKMDGFLMAMVILLTLAVLSQPQLYTVEFIGNDAGILCAVLIILAGAALRMVARGYKKAHSQNGAGLVTGGPYQYVRNPMYLGTFLIGVGFVAMAWPWWGAPLFAVAFYLRFRKQIRLEEEYLGGVFGTEYADYCARVPRVFPSWSGLRHMNLKTDFPWELAWTTNESRLMVFLPVVIVAVKVMTDIVVFHQASAVRLVIYGFLWAGLMWAVTRSRARG